MKIKQENHKCEFWTFSNTIITVFINIFKHNNSVLLWGLHVKLSSPLHNIAIFDIRTCIKLRPSTFFL